MSNRLDQEREKRLQPKRMHTALTKLASIGTVTEVYQMDETKLRFDFKGSTCFYYPYSGWASGKTIKDGRGLSNLLEQLT